MFIYALAGGSAGRFTRLRLSGPGHDGSMIGRPSTQLIQVAALCQMLVEALERLDDGLASESLVAELRELCERVRSELERWTPQER